MTTAHFRVRVFSTASGLGVLHAPRFDGGDYPFIVPTAAFVTDVFQLAFIDLDVVMTHLG